MNPTRLPKPIDRLAYGAYRAVFIRLRSSRALHRRLFGYTPHGPFPGPYWDYSTLDLRKEMRRSLKNDERFLDLGTGPFAPLGLYACLKLGLDQVTASDCLPDVVESARRHVHVQGCPMRVIQSRLFDSLEGEFDCIAFNPPYVSSKPGRDLGIFRREDEQARWDGGADGMDVIRPFLRDAGGFLSERGRVLLCVSHLFIDPAELRHTIDESGWRICRQAGALAGWSHLYVLTPETTDRLSAQ